MLKDSPLSLNSQRVTTAELFVGQQALELLSDNKFISQWSLLYQRCSWATVFQSNEFVHTWYEMYSGEFLPVLVKAEAEGELVGLLTLASFESRKGARFILGAGCYEADYHCWLSNPENSQEFIDAALTKVLDHFPKAHIILRHLPPGVSLDWLEDKKGTWADRSVVFPQHRPLMVFSDFKVSKRDRKRIKQLQAVSSFNKLSDEEEFARSLDELSDYYDFRQAAMFDKYPFRNDPIRKDFLLALFRLGILHVTTATHHDEVVASVAALISKNRANLGAINLHSPMFARYSPGFVHFLMLGQLLAAEGIESFDLTPGGDPYKERLATRHDPVQIVYITNSRRYLLKKKIKKRFYEYLERRGKRPMGVELQLARQIHPFRERGLAEIAKQARKILFPAKRKLFYGSIAALEATHAIQFRKNKLGDLLAYCPNKGEASSWEFMEEAMTRLDRGENCYTWAEGGQLLCCAWETAAPHNPVLEAMPNPVTVLDGLYVKGEARHMAPSFLVSVFKQLGRDEVSQERIGALTATNYKFVNNFLKKAGFTATYLPEAAS